MSRILGRQLVTLRESRLTTANKPSIIISRCNVLVVAIDYVVQVKCSLVSYAVGVTLVRFTGEGEAEEGKAVYFGEFRFEYGRLDWIDVNALREMS